MGRGQGRGEKGCGTAVRTEKKKKPPTKKSLLSHKLALKLTVQSLKERRSLGKQEEAAVREEGAEKHAGLRFGEDVKGPAIYSETGSKNKKKNRLRKRARKNWNTERGRSVDKENKRRGRIFLFLSLN